MNLLTAMSIMIEGVREVLPFIRYIAQYMDTEFDMIKSENKGQGVVCAATWYVHLLPPTLFLLTVNGLGSCLLHW